MNTPTSVTKTRIYYRKITKFLYCLGAPNFYYQDLDVPEFAKRIHDSVVQIIDFFIWVLIVMEFGSFYTQHNLSEKQESDRIIYAVCLPFCTSYIPVLSKKTDKIKEVFYDLAIKLKIYNDEEVEKQTAVKAKIFCAILGFFTLSMAGMYGVNGLYDVLANGKNFVTVITAWPDIEDNSQMAGVGRVFIYITFFLFFARLQFSVYIVVVLITIGISHQFKHLASYFRSLDDIFKDETLTQEEKEQKYEKAFKVGVSLHASTLRCTRQAQDICDVVSGLQSFVNIVVISLSLFQMMKAERNLTNLMQTIATSFCALVGTGCFWWNAGDITVEAGEISTAMFHSGWHHCRMGTARRIRYLIVIALWKSQMPVCLNCFGVVELSYRSFLSIVRATYSVFSVIY